MSRADAVTEHLPPLPGERQPAEPSLGRLACIVPGLLIAIAIAVGGGLVFINCLRASPSDMYTTRVDALPDGEPVFLSGPGIYLLRRGDDVIALSAYAARRQDGSADCAIRYRETIEAAGRRGVFRSDCTGALYGPDGAALDGSAPPMTRHVVRRDGGEITVDYRRCLIPDDPSRTRLCWQM